MVKQPKQPKTLQKRANLSKSVWDIPLGLVRGSEIQFLKFPFPFFPSFFSFLLFKSWDCWRNQFSSKGIKRKTANPKAPFWQLMLKIAWPLKKSWALGPLPIHYWSWQKCFFFPRWSCFHWPKNISMPQNTMCSQIQVGPKRFDDTFMKWFSCPSPFLWSQLGRRGKAHQSQSKKKKKKKIGKKKKRRPVGNDFWPFLCI